MHSKIFQITTVKATKEGRLTEDTLTQGEGSFYDYCMEIDPELRKQFIDILVNKILPNGLAETEYSYLSANEMASVELDATKFGLGKVRVEQRKPFQPCQLSEIFDRELQSFLNRLYD